MSTLKKRILHGQVKKIHFIDRLRYRFGEILLQRLDNFFRAFIIYFVCGGFQLSNPVGYRYVVNSHATSAYECELLAVTWHYLPSVRLDNAESVIRHTLTANAVHTRPSHFLRVLNLSLRLF